MSLEDRLRKYYQLVIDHGKTDDLNVISNHHISSVVEKHRDHEELLWQKLEAKYNIKAPSECTSVVAYSEEKKQAYRDRLVQFFQCYDPKRIPMADKLLEKFSGHEEDLFKSLTMKFGKEPHEMKTREQLYALYQHYDPSKLENIDEILAKYQGKYPELLEFLEKKYGPVPENNSHNNQHHEVINDSAQLSAQGLARKGSTHNIFRPVVPVNHEHRERLFRIYFYYEPTKLENLDFIENLLMKYRGKENALFQALEQKYGPAPPPLPTTNHRENLIQYYQFYGIEEKIPYVDILLEKYSGIEDEMWFLLVSKYGWVPSHIAGGNTSSSNVMMKKKPLRERLFNFYRKYDPSKATLEQVDKIVLKYGSENQEDLFAALEAKYGPE